MVLGHTTVRKVSQCLILRGRNDAHSQAKLLTSFGAIPAAGWPLGVVLLFKTPVAVGVLGQSQGEFNGKRLGISTGTYNYRTTADQRWPARSC